MKKTIVLCLLAALLVPALSGCGGGPSDKVVTINSSGNYIVSTLVIIKEESLMEKYLPEGYSVQWKSVSTSTEIRDGMLTGDISISAPALSTIISALENDIPFRVLSYMATPVYKMYVSDPAIQSVDDLGPEDKISITGYSGSMHLAFLAYCKEHFGDLDYFKSNLVVMPNAEALASLASGSNVSMSLFQFSTNLLAERDPDIRCIGDLTAVAEQYGVGQACVTTETYYQAHPEVIEAFLSAQEEAIALFYERPEYVADLLIRSGIEIEREDLLAAMPDSGPSGVLTAEQYDTLASFMYEAGMLDKAPRMLEEYGFYDSLVENNRRYH